VTVNLHLGAHLQAVGLHQIQRTQYPIHSRDDAEAILQKIDVIVINRVGIQLFISRSVESINAWAGIIVGKRGLKLLVSFVIQIRKILANVHEIAELILRHLGQLIVQGFGFIQKLRFGSLIGWQFAVVIQRFGR